MKRQLALYGLVGLLASCTTLQGDDGESTGAGSTDPETRAAGENGAPEGAPPTGTAAGGTADDRARRDARRDLIDSINREGRVPDGAGFRESPPRPAQAPDNDVVELNYEQADLQEILSDLADALDISLVVDPTIDEQVSIRTAPNRPLSYEDIWPLMRLLTGEAGVAIDQVGGVYHARPSDTALPSQIALAGDPLSGDTILQVTPITYVEAASVQQMLEPMLQPEGRVSRIGSGNTLAITANESQLRRANALLQLIDDDPFRSQGIRLYELDSASAADVGEELTEVLTLIEGESPAYQVQPLERINALLVTAPANRGFEEITRWVSLLDDADEEQAEQLFRYRVKNLNATELATTLSEVFRSEEDQEDSAPRSGGSAQDANSRQDTDTPETDGQDDAPGGNDMTVTRVAVSAELRVSIVADDSTNTLLIRATPRDYRQLLATINQLDSVPLQVMINAAIAQITLTDDTSFGVDWSSVAENLGSGSSTIATTFLPPRGENGTGGLGGLLFNRSFLDGAARIDATLEAIATNNDVRLLARPSITVVNNMEGLIRIGNEVPVQLGETATNVGVTSNIQYRPTGIELFITPRINDDGVVNLTIRQELSSLSEGSGINENPIFQNQEIETTVVARNGENVVLGGLIQDNNDQLNTGVPLLNRIPGIGGLFSYQRNNNERQELFIVLRPEIINLNEPGSNRYDRVKDRFQRAAQMIEDSEF